MILLIIKSIQCEPDFSNHNTLISDLFATETPSRGDSQPCVLADCAASVVQLNRGHTAVDHNYLPLESFDTTF